MRWLRIGVRLSMLVAHTFVGLFCAVVLFKLVGRAHRETVIRVWSRAMLRVIGVKFEIVGNASANALRGSLLICNHVSWIDIFVVNALVPAHFVAKTEIRGWPVLGLLAHHVGTLFIERGRRHAVHDVLKRMSAALNRRESCAIFPEGTTSNGMGVLPFHANLFQAALDARVPVRPLAVRYLRDGIATTIPAYVDDDTLADSMFAVLGTRGLQVRLNVLQAIDPSQFATRHEVAKQARQAVIHALGATQPDTAPAKYEHAVRVPQP